jgi:hypothetical protein
VPPWESYNHTDATGLPLLREVLPTPYHAMTFSYAMGRPSLFCQKSPCKSRGPFHHHPLGCHLTMTVE